MTEIFAASPLGPHDANSSLPNIYEPLQQGQIRLLELISGPNDSIRFEIHTYDLASAPAYYALSYVCGHQPSNYSILVNAQAVAVKENLFDALRRLVKYFTQLQIVHPLL